jgi:hypothetical protein
MRGKLKTFTYTFDKQFHVGSKDSFILVIIWILIKLFACLLSYFAYLKEFFQDEHVISSIKKLGQNGEWEPLSNIILKNSIWIK